MVRAARRCRNLWGYDYEGAAEVSPLKLITQRILHRKLHQYRARKNINMPAL